MLQFKAALIYSILFLLTYQLSAQNIKTTLDEYANNYQQEKLHIHFDKDLYYGGETVWFKVYILAGIEPSDNSKRFYIDWFNDSGKLITHLVYPVFESSTRGRFDIPTNYKGKYLIAKAYTQWMLNFDTAFLFSKMIKTSGSLPESRMNEDNLKGLNAQKEKKSIASATSLKSFPKTTIHFFPEGGQLVNGIASKVAFLAENENGMPVAIRGVLKSENGKMIDSFITEHDGMGMLYFQPLNNKTYSATWTDEYGVTKTTELPLAQEKGAVLEVMLKDKRVRFVINRTNEIENRHQKMYVIGQIQQNLVFKSTINLQTNKSASSEVSVADMPTGVLQITLLDSTYFPVAERIVFVNNEQHLFYPQVTVGKVGLGKKEKNEIEISVDDSLSTNMSIAITDGLLPVNHTSNIISDLLLSGDIKGYIPNPVSYFESNEDSVLHFLDLVMLTHGWRTTNWSDIKEGKMPLLTYAKEEDYMDFKGTILGIPANKTMQSPNLLLMLQGKDSSKQALILPIEKDKSFVQKGILFYDTLRAYYQLAGNKNNTDGVELQIKTGLLQPFESKLRPPAFVEYYGVKDSIELKYSEQLHLENIAINKQLGQQELQSVTVRTRTVRKVDELDRKYTSGLFSGGDSRQFDLVNDLSAIGMPDIFAYLEGKVPGLQIINTGAEIMVTRRGSNTQLYLDEIRVESDQLRLISINDVAYIKVFSPPFFGASGGGGGGAIAVYTRKGNDGKRIYADSKNYLVLTGFTAYKEFYNPQYTNNLSTEADARSTLYWNPYILTDNSKKKVKITFYNNDFSKKFRLILEGVNSDGKITRVEKIIE